MAVPRGQAPALTAGVDEVVDSTGSLDPEASLPLRRGQGERFQVLLG